MEAVVTLTFASLKPAINRARVKRLKVVEHDQTMHEMEDPISDKVMSFFLPYTSDRAPNTGEFKNCRNENMALIKPTKNENVV